MNLAFAVRDRRLTRKGLEPLAADTAGHITFTVDFDAEWTGMVKVVVALEESVSVMLSEKVQPVKR